jgi:hypothetical protein
MHREVVVNEMHWEVVVNEVHWELVVYEVHREVVVKRLRSLIKQGLATINEPSIVFL